jgi:hypothetical protein
VIKELKIKAPTTALAGTLGPTRQLAVVRRRLDDVHTAAHAWHVTVNDLALAAVASGLRALLVALGEQPPAQPLRASMPVAVVGRRANAGRMVIVELPVDDLAPVERLQRVAASTRRHKGEGDLAHTELTHSDAFPLFLARAGFRWLRRHGAGRVNLYTTNVVGPPTPLRVAGALLYDVIPIAPLVAGVRLGVAIFSYAGGLIITPHADGALSHLDLLADAIGEELDRLAAMASLLQPVTA